jgi:hypothetical protein
MPLFMSDYAELESAEALSLLHLALFGRDQSNVVFAIWAWSPMKIGVLVYLQLNFESFVFLHGIFRKQFSVLYIEALNYKHRFKFSLAI